MSVIDTKSVKACAFAVTSEGMKVTILEPPVGAPKCCSNSSTMVANGLLVSLIALTA